METPLSNSGNPPPKAPQRAPLALSGLDFKLLKVFKAVVEAGGFSAAQNELNVGLAAISKQISDLEIRIGMRLCTRGREGFHLTEEGRLVYQASIDLFASVDNFRDRLSSAQNELVGDLGVGVIDNTISDANSPLVAALRQINEQSPKDDWWRESCRSIKNAKSSIITHFMRNARRFIALLVTRCFPCRMQTWVKMCSRNTSA
jgi:hypothetical protein